MLLKICTKPFISSLVTFPSYEKSLICPETFQAAKEFETELKAPESAAEAPAEKPTPVIEVEKQDVKIPSSKESV